MSSQKRIGKTGVGDEVKEALCEVCMTNNHDNEINKKLICRCNRWVHKYCYSPEMVPKIICDTCKRGKGHKCDICGQ